jgi:hypothetical protein
MTHEGFSCGQAGAGICKFENAILFQGGQQISVNK